ncbi:hypothetical protein NLG97_g7335 [Lecanicillium saksenae]|uniref:Uncharacterized protein n=1 Tax=Lecanicillium saksenae TaxID=468837 RepID=A0ACC1QNP1_9HYPO|nr:hypothetical protein NLG97_g7335 [Lecanicillium saksenae]
MSDHEFGGNDDLSLPKATVQKIVTEILPPSAGVAFARESRDLLIECCVEFITLISSEANEISEKEAKKTIACDHITKALEQLGFSDYVPAVMEAAAEHKEVQKGREKKADKFANSGRRRRDKHQQRPRVPRWARSKMGQEESSMIDESTPPKTLSERSIAAIADYIKSGNVKRIAVMTGAGISTAAGIPDFRSPKTGLYNNLARLNLPHAEAVFEISYFKENPEPFYVLAKELYPGKFHPTVSHVFLSLLAKKGLLHMLFTQNIDCLERAAGVPPEKIIEAHGSFATQRCVECKKEFPDDEMKTHVENGDVPRCIDRSCHGLVKPDIVFFGEALPRAFSEQSHTVVMADLALIIGTSLQVYPFAGLPQMVRESMPRVLFNMEKVGQIGTRPDDVLSLGPCDDGIRELAAALGWADELEKMWRGIVGEEEAERQLRSQKERSKETALRIHDEESASNEAVASKSRQSEEGEPRPDILEYKTEERAEKEGSPKPSETLAKALETEKENQDKAKEDAEEKSEQDLSKSAL